MNIALVSMLDSNFIIGYKAFIKSLLKHNPDFSYPFVIFDMGLSKQEKEEIKSYYSHVLFKVPNYTNYKGTNFDVTAPCLHNTYYKLDIFSLYEYDRVVFIDMDIIVLDDIMELFTIKEPLAGCHGYAPSIDGFRKDMNTGVFVVNKQLLKKNFYNSIVNFCKQGFSMPDQKGINKFIRTKTDYQIHFIDKAYNCEKRMWKGKVNKIGFENNELILYPNKQKVKMVHYISEKPWQEKKEEINKGFERLEKIWWSYYNG